MIIMFIVTVEYKVDDPSLDGDAVILSTTLCL